MSTYRIAVLVGLRQTFLIVSSLPGLSTVSTIGKAAEEISPGTSMSRASNIWPPWTLTERPATVTSIFRKRIIRSV